jgi:hypothetical protein
MFCAGLGDPYGFPLGHGKALKKKMIKIMRLVECQGVRNIDAFEFAYLI